MAGQGRECRDDRRSQHASDDIEADLDEVRAAPVLRRSTVTG
ncbi:hypothetical protein [Bradyrhizobium sp. 138]|nr:hypothetical protein [Bradyrhizobium sp. 138]